MLLSHHMNEFNAGECDPGCGFRFKPKHRACASLDTAMILFNGVVHVFAGADRDGIARVFQPVFRITLQDGNAVGLTAVNGDPLWSAVSGQSLANKARPPDRVPC